MTTQELKNNRNEIISELECTVAPEFIKPAMEMMLRLANGDMLDGEDAEEVVEEVVSINPEWKKENANRVASAYSIGEINHMNARKNAPSNLR